MREYTDELNLNGDADQFNALTVALFATDGSRPILVCVEENDDAEKIAGLLAELLPEQPLSVAHYELGDQNLWSHSLDRSGGESEDESGDDAGHALQLFLPADQMSGVPLAKVAFANLDGSRDRPASAASTPILFLQRSWLPTLAEVAPEFYASRYGTFFFLCPELLVGEDQDEETAVPESHRLLPAFTPAEHNERIATFEAVLEDLANGLQSAEIPDLEGTLKLRLGSWLLWADRLDEAEAVLQQVLTLARSEGDFEEKSAAINNLALVFQSQGREEQALALFEEDLQLCEDRGDLSGQAKTLNNLGNSFSALGRWGEAVDCLQRSLQLKSEIGDGAGQNSTLANLANVFAAQGRWQKALEFHRKSLALCRIHGFRAEEAIALRNEAEVYTRFTTKFQKAVDLLKDSLAIFHEEGLSDQEAGVWEWLGYAYGGLEARDEAIASYEQALNLWRQLGEQGGQARALSGLGGIHESAERWEEAISCFQRSLVVCREMEDRNAQGQVNVLLGRVFLQQGRFELALQSFDSSAKLFRAIGEPHEESDALSLLARAYRALRQWKEAEAATERALELCRSVGDRVSEGLNLTCLAQIKEEEGLLPEALGFARAAVEILGLSLEREVLAIAVDIVARLDKSPSSGARRFLKKFTKK